MATKRSTETTPIQESTAKRPKGAAVPRSVRLLWEGDENTDWDEANRWAFENKHKTTMDQFLEEAVDFGDSETVRVPVQNIRELLRNLMHDVEFQTYRNEYHHPMVVMRGFVDSIRGQDQDQDK